MCGDTGLYQFNSIVRERFSEAAREQIERAEKLFDEMCKRGAIFHMPVTKALSIQDFREG